MNGNSISYGYGYKDIKILYGYIVIFFICILISFSALAEPFTLENALALAYTNSPALQAERAKLRATDEQISQALSNWRPSIDAVGDAGRGRQNVTGDGIPSTPTIYNPSDASVTITQPVFRGFRTTGSVHSAEATIEAGRAALQNAEQQILLDSAKAYLDVLLAQDIVLINRANEADLQQQLDMTRDRLRIGELRRTDVNQAESRLKVAMVGRLEAENDLMNKRTTFARLIGEMPGMLTKPILTLAQPTSLQDATIKAIEKSPAVIVATHNDEAAKADVTVAKGNLLPEVSVIGNAARNQQQNITFPERQDSLSVVARLTVPLYRSGSDYSKTRAAIQTENQRKMELDDSRNKAKETATNAWQTLMTARSVIAGDKEALIATDSALYGVKEEAKIGTRTIIDVLNAEQELLNAKVNLVRAEHDEIVALLQVKASIGDLTAEALHLPVEIYNPVVHYNKIRDKWLGFGDAQ
jgi:outer membrane protein